MFCDSLWKEDNVQIDDLLSFTNWLRCLVAPHMTGMWLKLFVKLIEAPLIGSLIISNLKKQNKTDQV